MNAIPSDELDTRPASFAARARCFLEIAAWCARARVRRALRAPDEAKVETLSARDGLHSIAGAE